MNVGFVGLGVMGYPMAGHLSEANFNTRVFNRTKSKALNWLSEYRGEAFDTPKETATGCEIVAICVGNDQDVKEVVLGPDGVLSAMKPDSILIDHTTTSADLAEFLSVECQQKGVHFIDAPVSGGQLGAELGKLSTMCGGDLTVFNRAKPVLHTYSKQVALLGNVGQGQRCKMVNQICIAGTLRGLSEALLLAHKSNLDTSQVVDIIKHGAAGSWQLENRAVTMSEDKFDFGFAIDWMLKDLTHCLNEAQKHDLSISMVEDTLEIYKKLQLEGAGRLDTSALIKSYHPSEC